MRWRPRSTSMVRRSVLPLVAVALAKRADPARGDLVLFSLPGSDHLATKRVVAIPGDVVEVRAGRLVVNGTPAVYRPPGASAPSNSMIEEWNGRSRLVTLSAESSESDSIRVPAGHFYVLGDHRGQSLDSREFGPVPRGSIRGRVLLWKRPAREGPQHASLRDPLGTLDLGPNYN